MNPHEQEVPWQNERWACAPTPNDGKNFTEPHRWAIMPARPLCFGWSGILCPAAGLPCGHCSDWMSRWCYVGYKSLRKWASPEARTAALLRVYTREAHELRQRMHLLEFMAFKGPLSRRELIKENEDLKRHIEELTKERTPSKLKAARIKCGLTQKQLASLVGIPQSNISQMEHGTRSINKGKALKFAEILGETEDYFKDTHNKECENE